MLPLLSLLSFCLDDACIFCTLSQPPWLHVCNCLAVTGAQNTVYVKEEKIVLQVLKMHLNEVLIGSWGVGNGKRSNEVYGLNEYGAGSLRKVGEKKRLIPEVYDVAVIDMQVLGR